MSSLPVARWESRTEQGYWCPHCNEQDWGTPSPFGAMDVKECHRCGTRFTLGAQPDLLNVEFSDRGFAQFGDAVETTYGHKVRVYESSSAEDPHIWLNIAGDVHLDSPGLEGLGGPVERRKGEGGVSAHMTLEQARAIHARLDAAIEFMATRFS